MIAPMAPRTKGRRKYLRQDVSLRTEERATLLQRLQAKLGAGSLSEVVCRLIDEEGRRQGLASAPGTCPG